MLSYQSLFSFLKSVFHPPFRYLGCFTIPDDLPPILTIRDSEVRLYLRRNAGSDKETEWGRKRGLEWPP